MENDKPASMKDESIQSMGGIARAESLSPNERSEIARKAAETRWSPTIPRATHEGTLHIGETAISCAVLENERRLLSQSDFMRALGRARQAKGRQYYDADVNLPAFLTAKNLKPFISKDLEVTSSQIEFRTARGNRAFGYPAELLPKVCDVFLDAEDAAALTRNQKHIAIRAKLLIRGLAHVGIIALVDEATGFQRDRDREALQLILEQFLRKELAVWVKTFPDEFYKQIYRLKGWSWPGMEKNRYSVVANYTRDLIYERLTPGLLKELEERNPRDEKGRRKVKFFQWLSDEIGHPALAQHLYAVIGLMRASNDWRGFHSLINRAFPRRGNTLELGFIERVSTSQEQPS